MEIRAIMLHEKDNVAVLAQEAKSGDTLLAANSSLPVLEEIPAGHKIAIQDIKAGADIYKYGTVIGRAYQDIRAGQWVHTHNVEDITEQLCNEYAKMYRTKAKEAKGNG